MRQAPRAARKRHGPKRQRSLVGPYRYGDGDEKQPAQVALHDLPQAHTRQVCVGSRAWPYDGVCGWLTRCLSATCLTERCVVYSMKAWLSDCRSSGLTVAGGGPAPASETGPSVEIAAAHLLSRDHLLCGADSRAGLAVRTKRWSANTAPANIDTFNSPQYTRALLVGQGFDSPCSLQHHISAMTSSDMTQASGISKQHTPSE